MKTKTKSQLVDFISVNGEARPAELANKFGLSPQIIHRHLKALINEGIIESKGSPPFTQYVIANQPLFKNAFDWFAKNSDPTLSPYVSETRDVFSARLNHFIPLQKQGISQNELSLIISTAGEIGNNSFDHNLGQWKDVPGCWFEFQLTSKFLWVLVSDRGQGIYRSLLRVLPKLKNEQEAINKAFTESISGRAPEQRGNGLKYVTQVITKTSNRGIACISGNGHIHFGNLGQKCFSALSKVSNNNMGTITLMAWGLK
jgi:hypothetical protein